VTAQRLSRLDAIAAKKLLRQLVDAGTAFACPGCRFRNAMPN
jgi:hypothetical protein